MEVWLKCGDHIHINITQFQRGSQGKGGFMEAQRLARQRDIFGWLKHSFGFFHKRLWKIRMKVLANAISKEMTVTGNISYWLVFMKLFPRWPGSSLESYVKVTKRSSFPNLDAYWSDLWSWYSHRILNHSPVPLSDAYKLVISISSLVNLGPPTQHKQQDRVWRTQVRAIVWVLVEEGLENNLQSRSRVRRRAGTPFRAFCHSGQVNMVPGRQSGPPSGQR